MTAVRLPLRPFTDADYPAYIALNNRLRPDKTRSVEEARHFETHQDEDDYRGRFLLEEDGNLIAATSFARDMNQLSKRVLVFDLLLGLEHFGLADALFEHLLGAAAPYRPEASRVSVREDSGAWRAFYAARRYEEYERRWISQLDVTGFDPAPFARSLHRAEAAGIRFTTLAELPGNEATQRALYEAVTEILRDVPFSEPLEIWPFERWQARWWDNPRRQAESYFLAFDGDEIAGVSELFASERDDKLATGLTGVRRAYRRRGVAQALKLKAVAYAKNAGTRTISTMNHSVNRPMLAINEAMGFVKEPAWLYLKRSERAPWGAQEAT